MSILEVREIIAKALQGCDDLERVCPLGNVVYVHVEDVEYEVVIRTVRPEWGPRGGPTNGPVAQE